MPKKRKADDTAVAAATAAAPAAAGEPKSKKPKAATAPAASNDSKSDKKSKKSTAAAPAAVAAAAGSGDFVRGKAPIAATAAATTPAAAAGAATSLPVKRHHLDSDVLFGTHKSVASAASAAAAGAAGAGAGTKKDQFAALNEQKKQLRKEKKLRSKSGGGVSANANRAAKFAETLSFRQLKPGMLMLGAIAKINAVDLTIHLPHGLTGYVSLREVSDGIAAVVDSFIDADDNDDADAKKSADGDADGDAVDGESESESKSKKRDAALPELEKMFSIGRIVKCAVLSLDTKKQAAKGSDSKDGANPHTAHKRIELTMRSSAFNASLTLSSLEAGLSIYGSIKSREDKGYVVDIGLPASEAGVSAFLPYKSAPIGTAPVQPKSKTGAAAAAATAAATAASGERYAIGQPIDCLIASVSGRAITLSADPSAVAKTFTRSSASAGANGALKLTSLKPGMLVKAQVDRVLENGLSVTFCDAFRGSIDLNHLASPATNGWENQYDDDSTAAAAADGGAKKSKPKTDKTKLKARILFIDYELKRIGLTLKPNLVLPATATTTAAAAAADTKQSAAAAPATITAAAPTTVSGSVPFTFPIDILPGDILPGATVCRVEPKIGVLLQVHSKLQRTEAWAYAHVSRVSDNRETQLTRSFPVGSAHTCRVLSLHRLDGLVQVSMQHSVLSQAILWYEDVKPGMLVDAEVLKLESFGCLVKLAPNVRAIIPALHMSDLELTEVSKAKKFAAGKSIKCRVLTVDYVKKKVALTAKKTLVQSTLPIVTSYDKAQKGMIVHGSITNAKDYGCTVEFYGGVHGLAPLADIQKTTGLDQHPSSVYRRGQCIKCSIVSVDPVKRKMTITFGTAQKEAGAGATAAAHSGSLQVGTIVAGFVKSATADALQIELTEHKGVVGVLPAVHMTDHPALREHALPLMHSYSKAGTVLEHLLVVSLDRAGVPLLSMKPSLIAGAKAERTPATFEAVHPNTLLSGFVKNITEFGVFVSFLANVTGLAPRPNLADHFVPDPKEAFAIGQSVRAFVVEVDASNKKMVVNLKPSACREANDQQKSDARFVRSLFRERDRIDSYLESKAAAASAGSVDWSSQLRYGDVVTAPVQYVKEIGVVVSLPLTTSTGTAATATGLAMRPYHTGERDENVQSGADRKAFRKAHNKSVRETTEAMKDGAAEDGGDAASADMKDGDGDDGAGGDAKKSGSKSIASQRSWAVGQSVKCRVLDVNREKRIADITLRDELISAAAAATAKGKTKSKAAAADVSAVKEGETVPVVIQLVKQQYCVLSLPSHGHRIGFACATNYNLRMSPHSVFQAGYACNAYVSHVPTNSPDEKVGRLLLVLDLSGAMAQHAGAGGKLKKSKNSIQFYDSSIVKRSGIALGTTLKVKIRGTYQTQYLTLSLGV